METLRHLQEKYKSVNYLVSKVKPYAKKIILKAKNMQNPEQKYKSINYLIAILKAYGVKNIVSSPGTQNAMFNLFIQNDKFFNCISVTDERSAGYVATGIAFETQEPVVITCTEATASRNYAPALTEAFYKNLPVIAIPFYDRRRNEYSMSAQFTDRSVTQNDIKLVQVKLPEISDKLDKERVLTYLNAAVFNAKYNKKPVIIEAPSILDFACSEEYNNVPNDIWHTECVECIDDSVAELLRGGGQNIAVFIGSHPKFTPEQQDAISKFARTWNAPVFCDHTSNYHGENKILSGKAGLTNIAKPDLIVDIGGVTGTFLSGGNAERWRIEPSKEFRCRNNSPVSKIFATQEEEFFAVLWNKGEQTANYYQAVKSKVDAIVLPETPLSSSFIASKLSKYIPNGSSLHLAIYNSLRGMNFFELDDSIDVDANVGGFGIDGPVSTAIGQSLANPDKKVFLFVGDLAFFYDMNALQNRDIKSNVRVLLVNNNGGVEFKLGHHPCHPIADKVDKFIASFGHKTTADGWAQSCGFHYMSAKMKEEFSSQIQDFCKGNYDKPVLFEVFTKAEEEMEALDLVLGVSRA